MKRLRAVGVKGLRTGEKLKGLTLIELLATMSLTGVIVCTVLLFYTFGYRLYYRSSLNIELQQNARLAADRISNELRWAKSFNILEGGKKIEYLDLAGERYVFQLRNNELELVIGTAVTKVASQIKSVSFVQGDNGLLEYEVMAGGEESEYLLTSTVRPRNRVTADE